MSDISDESCGAYIGYVESCVDRWKLESRFFPSKVGGYPAWLGFKDIPNAEDLKCLKCGTPCVFLCQVYAPIDERNNCFHRTIFVFICLNPECCNKNVNLNIKVFRCQLPRKNDFYPYEPPVFEENWRREICASGYWKLCVVCGCGSKSRCSKCKTTYYCCKQHQVLDWKAGHKDVCRENNAVDAKKKLLLPEYELLKEPEDDYSDSSNSSSDEEGNGEKNSDALGNIKPTFQNDSHAEMDLIRMARGELPDDRTFQHFRKRTNQHPREVLRYERGGEPLWITKKALPPTVPPCQLCGAERQFEFQVLPQLLNHLGIDRREQSVDWGTLAVYTCADSCDAGPPYKPEFVWKQDLS